MATIIDALIVTLGLDPSGYKKGAQEAAGAREKLTKEEQEAARKRSQEEARAAREREEQHRRWLDGYRKIRNEMLGLLALFTAGRGVKDYIRDLTAGDAASGRFARTVNLSVESLTAWEEAAKRVGGTAQGMDATMAALTQGFQNYRMHGVSEMIPYMNQLGLSFAQFTDQAGNFHPDQMLLAINDAFRRLNLSPQQQVAFARALHLDQGALQLMAEENLRGLVAQTAAQGTPSAESAQRSQQLIASLLDAQQLVTSTVRDMLNEVTPDILDMLRRFVGWLREMKPQLVEDFRRAFRRLHDEVRRFFEGEGWQNLKRDIVAVWEAINRAVEGMGGWTRAAEVFLGLWAAAKVGPAVLGIGMLALAFGRLGTSLLGVGASASRLGWLGRLLGIGGATAGGLLALPLLGAKDHGRNPFDFIGNPELTKPTLGDNIRRFLGWATGGHLRFDRSAATGQYGPVLDLIGRAEGTDRGRGYNETLARGRLTGGDVNLTGMTMREVQELQTRMLQKPANRWNSSAVGRYQFVRSTLFGRDGRPGLVQQLGISMDERFDERMQDRLAAELIRRSGLTPEGLASQWDSLPDPLRGNVASHSGRGHLGATPAEVQDAIRRAREARPGPRPENTVPRVPRVEDLPRVSMWDTVSPARVAMNTANTNFHGDIHIHTAATDARGIQRDLYAELKRRNLFAQAATGTA